MLDIKIVTNSLGDWAGLYVDDDLVYENHRIENEILLKHLSERLPINYNTKLEIDSEELPKDIMNKF